MTTVLINIKTIVNVIKCNSKKVKIDELEKIEITDSPDGSSLAILIDAGGNITNYGNESDILKDSICFDKIINCKGGCVLPGFVDAHTHPVWDGDIVDEFYQKCKVGYIDKNVDHTSNHSIISKTSGSDENVLFHLLTERIKSMVKKGTTTVECKSGYGLNFISNEKLLRVLNRAKKELPIDMSITYLPAYPISCCDVDEYTKDIINSHIPKLKCLCDDGILNIDNIDINAEKGYFDISNASKILEAGKEIGLNLNIHADKCSQIGGAELAGRLCARAASHLEEASPLGVAAMAMSGTVAVLLPISTQILGLRPPPVRAILQAGVPIALGTDFNPETYCLSMPIAMFLACTMMNMSPEEALIASTINAAYSLGMSDKIGAITPGRQADLIVLSCDKWENIIFQLGETESIINYVIKKGRIIYSKQNGFNGI